MTPEQNLQAYPETFTEIKLPRRRLLVTALKLASLPALEALAAACRGIQTPLATPTKDGSYPLTKLIVDGRPQWVDKPLEESGGLVSRLRFDYDINYPKRDGRFGAIALEAMFNSSGKLRIISEEIQPNPRFLFMDECPYDMAAKVPLRVHPVIDLHTDDLERIYVGYEEITFINMRVYEIKRTGRSSDELEGRFVGLTTIDPETVKPEQPPKPCPK